MLIESYSCVVLNLYTGVNIRYTIRMYQYKTLFESCIIKKLAQILHHATSMPGWGLYYYETLSHVVFL